MDGARGWEKGRKAHNMNEQDEIYPADPFPFILFIRAVIISREQ